MSRVPLFGLVFPALAAGVLAGCGWHSSSILQRTATVEKSAVAVVIQQGVTIRLVQGSAPGRQSFQIEGLEAEAIQALRSEPPDSARWPRFFSAYVEPNGQTNLPPIQGRHSLDGERLRFEPAYPLQPGLSYRVELRLGELPAGSASKTEPVIAWFKIGEQPKVPKTIVERIYPTADRLPENLLKFYVHFSAPMSRGGIYEHIQLLGPSGKPIELPFLEIDEELWNPEMTRLTLFIDPGRIKRGVRPLEEVGPALEEGGRYTLMIGRQWRDAEGAPLKASYRKVFRVDSPDREPPNPAAWIVQAPKGQTHAPLTIRFTDPMDHALAERLIWVSDGEGRRVDGSVALSDKERLWEFRPSNEWRPGAYRIVIGSVVEDLAGNSVGRPFEVDVFDPIQRRISDREIGLEFKVAPGGR